MLPLVAIVGRPNVGKSTLFNRLVGRRRALVAHESGLTRDRHYGMAAWEGRTFQIVDTGGFESEATGLDALIRAQTESAIEEADLLVMVMDAREGLTTTDMDLASRLRRTSKPVLHVVNKVDGPRQESLAAEFYSLAPKALHAVSAEHGRGFDELIDDILAGLPATDATSAPDEAAPQDRPIRVALVGRPNAGKSALLNRLTGSERSIVSEVPGTTRDPIDADLTVDGQRFTLVDTAGLRRKRRAASFMEQIAALRAQRTIHEAHVACLLIDTDDEIAAQDAKIASMAVEIGRALVLVFTKADLLSGPRTAARRKIAEQVRERLRFVEFAPQLFVSALSGRDIQRVLPAARAAYEQWNSRVATAELNRFFETAVQAHPPPSHHGRLVRLYYVTQADVRPPTFVVMTNYPAGIPEAYRRYLANRIRERFGFKGTPFRLFFRPKKERKAR